MPVVRIENRLVRLARVLGSGTQATVYEHPERPGLAVKLYKEPTPEDQERVEAMLQAPPDPLLEGSTPAFAWPTLPVLSSRAAQLVGFAMPRSRRAVELGYLLDPLSRPPSVGQDFLLRVACSLSLRLDALHYAGYVRGDIQPQNELANRRGVVTSIDLDSTQFSVGDRLFPARYGIYDYQAPELQGAVFEETVRTPAQDVWAAATLIHRLLRQGWHPFACQFTGTGPRPDLCTRIRAGYWPDGGRHRGFLPPRTAPAFGAFDPELQDLFRRTFDAGHGDPDARPGLAEFVVCLERLAHRRLFYRGVSPWSWRGHFFPGESQAPARLALATTAAASLVGAALVLGTVIVSRSPGAATPPERPTPAAAVFTATPAPVPEPMASVPVLPAITIAPSLPPAPESAAPVVDSEPTIPVFPVPARRATAVRPPVAPTVASGPEVPRLWRALRENDASTVSGFLEGPLP